MLERLEARDRDGGSIEVLVVEVSPWKLKWKRERNEVELLRASNDICEDGMESKPGQASALRLWLLLLVHSPFWLISYMYLSPSESAM